MKWGSCKIGYESVGYGGASELTFLRWSQVMLMFLIGTLYAFDSSGPYPSAGAVVTCPWDTVTEGIWSMLEKGRGNGPWHMGIILKKTCSRCVLKMFPLNQEPHSSLWYGLKANSTYCAMCCCVGAPLNILLFIYEDGYIITPETEGKTVMLSSPWSFIYFYLVPHI